MKAWTPRIGKKLKEYTSRALSSSGQRRRVRNPRKIRDLHSRERHQSRTERRLVSNTEGLVNAAHAQPVGRKRSHHPASTGREDHTATGKAIENNGKEKHAKTGVCLLLCIGNVVMKGCLWFSKPQKQVTTVAKTKQQTIKYQCP